jgi:hypothetical protein
VGLQAQPALAARTAAMLDPSGATPEVWGNFMPWKGPGKRYYYQVRRVGVSLAAEAQLNTPAKAGEREQELGAVAR